MYIPGPLFSVGSKVIRNTLCARRRGSLLQPLTTHVFTCVVRMRQQWCLLSTGSGLGTRLVCRVVPRNVVLRNQPYESHPNLTVHVRACDVHDVCSSSWERKPNLVGCGRRPYVALHRHAQRASLRMLTKHSYVTSRVGWLSSNLIG